jgi:hypothetical protein
MSLPVVGVDFDNTIVRFDTLFHVAAVEQGLIPGNVAASKTAVRDYLRREGREPEWTALQGYVYGVKIRDAQPFPGVLEFFQQCRDRDWPAFVISHKTLHPFAGPKYELHEAARAWLGDRGFLSARSGLTADHVFLELTKDAKLRRIGTVGCGWFVDDLPEFLAEPTFPTAVRRILFDPHGEHADSASFPRLRSWADIGALIP